MDRRGRTPMANLDVRFCRRVLGCDLPGTDNPTTAELVSQLEAAGLGGFIGLFAAFAVILSWAVAVRFHIQFGLRTLLIATAVCGLALAVARDSEGAILLCLVQEICTVYPTGRMVDGRFDPGPAGMFIQQPCDQRGCVVPRDERLKSSIRKHLDANWVFLRNPSSSAIRRIVIGIGCLPLLNFGRGA
jgi:hypothetical protein